MLHYSRTGLDVTFLSSAATMFFSISLLLVQGTRFRQQDILHKNPLPVARPDLQEVIEYAVSRHGQWPIHPHNPKFAAQRVFPKPEYLLTSLNSIKRANDASTFKRISFTRISKTFTDSAPEFVHKKNHDSGRELYSEPRNIAESYKLKMAASISPKRDLKSPFSGSVKNSYSKDFTRWEKFRLQSWKHSVSQNRVSNNKTRKRFNQMPKWKNKRKNQRMPPELDAISPKLKSKIDTRPKRIISDTVNFSNSGRGSIRPSNTVIGETQARQSLVRNGSAEPGGGSGYGARTVRKHQPAIWKTNLLQNRFGKDSQSSRARKRKDAFENNSFFPQQAQRGSHISSSLLTLSNPGRIPIFTRMVSDTFQKHQTNIHRHKLIRSFHATQTTLHGTAEYKLGQNSMKMKHRKENSNKFPRRLTTHQARRRNPSFIQFGKKRRVENPVNYQSTAFNYLQRSHSLPHNAPFVRGETRFSDNTVLNNITSQDFLRAFTRLNKNPFGNWRNRILKTSNEYNIFVKKLEEKGRLLTGAINRNDVSGLKHGGIEQRKAQIDTFSLSKNSDTETDKKFDDQFSVQSVKEKLPQISDSGKNVQEADRKAVRVKRNSAEINSNRDKNSYRHNENNSDDNKSNTEHKNNDSTNSNSSENRSSNNKKHKNSILIYPKNTSYVENVTAKFEMTLKRSNVFLPLLAETSRTTKSREKSRSDWENPMIPSKGNKTKVSLERNSSNPRPVTHNATNERRKSGRLRRVYRKWDTARRQGNEPFNYFTRVLTSPHELNDASVTGDGGEGTRVTPLQSVYTGVEYVSTEPRLWPGTPKKHLEILTKFKKHCLRLRGKRESHQYSLTAQDELRKQVEICFGKNGKDLSIFCKHRKKDTNKTAQQFLTVRSSEEWGKIGTGLKNSSKSKNAERENIAEFTNFSSRSTEGKSNKFSCDHPRVGETPYPQVDEKHFCGTKTKMKCRIKMAAKRLAESVKTWNSKLGNIENKEVQIDRNIDRTLKNSGTNQKRDGNNHPVVEDTNSRRNSQQLEQQAKKHAKHESDINSTAKFDNLPHKNSRKANFSSNYKISINGYSANKDIRSSDTNPSAMNIIPSVKMNVTDNNINDTGISVTEISRKSSNTNNTSTNVLEPSRKSGDPKGNVFDAKHREGFLKYGDILSTMDLLPQSQLIQMKIEKPTHFDMNIRSNNGAKSILGDISFQPTNSTKISLKNFRLKQSNAKIDDIFGHNSTSGLRHRKPRSAEMYPHSDDVNTPNATDDHYYHEYANGSEDLQNQSHEQAEMESGKIPVYGVILIPFENSHMFSLFKVFGAVEIALREVI
ncbi:hypothetical protein PoB_001523500 [Plakobranchus ocellatus]|uniref:Uncharacterized protein n=1 Tax=Plakobranchus ocellatus TaxID=259542 RepID=A0AAV3YZY3_9GAST|nr:hypothetical protein PoB_001523500 [Plakobranchus ocellatus]